MKYASVTDVVRRIKEDVYKDYKLQSVAMEGNIIGLKRASNGHYYMNLRDDNCSIHVTDGIAADGLSPLALTFSPIKGADGNIEYLLYSRKDMAEHNEITEDMIDDIVEKSHQM